MLRLLLALACAWPAWGPCFAAGVGQSPEAVQFIAGSAGPSPTSLLKAPFSAPSPVEDGSQGLPRVRRFLNRLGYRGVSASKPVHSMEAPASDAPHVAASVVLKSLAAAASAMDAARTSGDLAREREAQERLERLFNGAPRLPDAAANLPAPLQSWIHAEQHLLSRDADPDRFTSPALNFQDPRYAPEAGNVFALQSRWLSAADAHVFTGRGLTQGLRRTFLTGTGAEKRALLLIHPESEAFYGSLMERSSRGPDFLAAPTASSRSLLAWYPGREREAFIAKLSLDREIAGVVRTIPKGEVARSIGVNDLLALDQEHLPAGFKAFPEVLGLIPKGLERGGMIVRALPAALAEGTTRLLPLFALFGPADARTPPPLADMARLSGAPAADFIRGAIVRPFLAQWLRLAIERGIVMEPHAQNVMVELGRDGMPNGSFVHRDFGGFNVDFGHRRGRGLPIPETLPIIASFGKDYHQNHHGSSLSDSLHTYFSGGFLYALDGRLRTWERRGWVRSGASGRTSLQDALVRDFEGLFRMLTGLEARLWGDLRNAKEAVYRARRRL